MKCLGNCEIEMSCSKCNRNIVVIVEEEKVTVLENRRESDKSEKSGQVRISLPKPKKQSDLRKAANY